MRRGCARVRGRREEARAAAVPCGACRSDRRRAQRGICRRRRRRHRRMSLVACALVSFVRYLIIIIIENQTNKQDIFYNLNWVLTLIYYCVVDLCLLATLISLNQLESASTNSF